jgi:hypothetical protein
MRTKLAVLIAQEEGFGRAGVLPTIDHNPGDLRHSPNSSHPGDPNAIGVIPTDALGWSDLERQLERDAARGWTLRQAIYSWAPAGDGSNDPARYLADILAGFEGAVTADTPLSEVLEIQA